MAKIVFKGLLQHQWITFSQSVKNSNVAMDMTWFNHKLWIHIIERRAAANPKLLNHMQYDRHLSRRIYGKMECVISVEGFIVSSRR